VKDLKAAIESGDIEAFLRLCAQAVAERDIDAIEIGLAALQRLPAGLAEPLKRKVRETYPELVAGLPAFAESGAHGPLGPSTPLNALLQRAIDGDRDGALREIRAGRVPKMPGGMALAEAIVRQVPARDALPRPLLQDCGEDVLVTGRGERGTFVVFTGLGERVWLDLPVFDAWLAQAGYRGVYLRDRSRKLYTEGIQAQGDRVRFEAQLKALRDEESGEFVFMGASSGGFGAMYWACLLGVGRTLAFGSATSTSTERLQAIGDDRVLLLQRLLMPEGGGPDLREHMLATGHTGRVDLHYGGATRFDRAHAEYLDLPNVRHHPIDGWSHHQMLQPLAASGRLPAILRGEA
jgi:hypothetical protein